MWPNFKLPIFYYISILKPPNQEKNSEGHCKNCKNNSRNRNNECQISMLSLGVRN
uniref:Uncharacterized protein n=1 Tax=Rhizophora mucronata TaxID=61149 RepID=A0A2P2III2_RHIMU